MSGRNVAEGKMTQSLKDILEELIEIEKLWIDEKSARPVNNEERIKINEIIDRLNCKSALRK
jgi:hypothetical protein